MTTAVSRDYACNVRRRTTRHLPLKSDLAIQSPAVLGLREVASTHRPRNKVEKLTVGRGIARSDALRAEALERDTCISGKERLGSGYLKVFNGESMAANRATGASGLTSYQVA
jgi:hypothetical protein